MFVFVVCVKDIASMSWPAECSCLILYFVSFGSGGQYWLSFNFLRVIRSILKFEQNGYLDHNLYLVASKREITYPLLQHSTTIVLFRCGLAIMGRTEL